MAENQLQEEYTSRSASANWKPNRPKILFGFFFKKSILVGGRFGDGGWGQEKVLRENIHL